jgi:carboxyl-terminal processing protease
VGSDRTFGKGTVQVVSPLGEGLGAIKVTTGMFFLPGGLSTQQRGVPADIEVPSIFNGEDVGEQKMDHSLKPQSTAPFLSTDVNGTEAGSHWTPVDEKVVKTLAERSKARVAKDKDFDKTREDLAHNKKKAPVKLSELLKKEKKDDQKATARERLKNMEAPLLKESVNIMADWLALPNS